MVVVVKKQDGRLEVLCWVGVGGLGGGLVCFGGDVWVWVVRARRTGRWGRVMPCSPSIFPALAVLSLLTPCLAQCE